MSKMKMKCVVLLIFLFSPAQMQNGSQEEIGVQSQVLKRLNKEAEGLAEENDKVAEELVNTYDKIKEAEDEIPLINGNLTDVRKSNNELEKKVNDTLYNLLICETDEKRSREELENLENLERRVDEVKEEEKRHRSELKAIQDEQKNHPANLEALNRELTETQNNLKLLEPELPELRLKLSKCAEESKYHQSMGKDGGGFVNKIVTSTLDNVKQLKKGVANVLRSKINFLKFNIPE